MDWRWWMQVYNTGAVWRGRRTGTLRVAMVQSKERLRGHDIKMLSRGAVALCEVQGGAQRGEWMAMTREKTIFVDGIGGSDSNNEDSNRNLKLRILVLKTTPDSN